MMAATATKAPGGRPGVSGDARRAELDRAGSAEDRFWRWREAVGTLFDTAVESTAALDAFDACLLAYRMPPFVLLRMSGSGHLLRRSPTLIASSSIDHYLLRVHGSGGVLRAGSGGERTLEPGSVSVVDLLQPFDLSCQSFDDICLVLPRGSLLPLVHRPEALHGLVIPGGTGSAGLIGMHMRSFARRAENFTRDLTEAELCAVSELALRVIEPMLGRVVAEPGSLDLVGHPIVVSVRQEIERRLNARDLGAEDLARRFNLSRATLYRAFAVQGGVAGYIRERRLARALRDITASSSAHRRIGEIAYGWGFPNEAAFSKAFKKSFGLSPREARLAAAPGGVVASDPVAVAITAWLKELAPLSVPVADGTGEGNAMGCP